MRIPAASLLLLALACNGSREAPRTSTTALTGSAKPSKKPPRTGSPEPACPRSDPSDPFGAHFTVGNRWTYRYRTSWHASPREQAVVTLRVTWAGQVDGYRAALLAADDNPVVGTHVVVQKNKGVPIALECLTEVPSDETAIAEAIGECRKDLEDPRSEVHAFCGETLCGAAFASEISQGGDGFSDEGNTWRLPGVGYLSAGRAEYSAETGDGSSTERYLLGYDLAAVPPRTLEVRDEEPLLAQLRSAIMRAAKAGDAKAVAKLVQKDIRYGLHPEHSGLDSAMESWQHDDGLALKRLSQALESCGVVAEGELLYAICPRAEADRQKSLAGRCRVRPESSPPRALFEKRGKDWRLTQMLLGGIDDHYVADEASSLPALPASMAAEFR
jgi:hypothetical protein